MIRLTAQYVTLDAAEGDQPSRTITGLAVPWDTVATLSGGEQVKFLKGSLPEDGPAPKLLEYHDDTRVIGVVTERVVAACMSMNHLKESRPQCQHQSPLRSSRYGSSAYGVR